MTLVPYEDRDDDAGFNDALMASTSILSPGPPSSKEKSFLIARDWPPEPKSLKKPIMKTAGSVLLSAVLILTPLPFLALAVAVAVINGELVVESDWSQFKTATRLVSHPRIQSSS
jgi:hypothetical protein